MSNLWSKKEIDFLISEYDKRSVDDLAKLLDRSINSIYYKSCKLKLSHKEYNRNHMSITSKKYKINENFLDNIDCEEKAYFLGLMFSDGYINKKQTIVSISLKESDKDLLLKVNAAIGNTAPLRYYKDNREYHGSNRYVLSFSCKQIINKLFELGYVQGNNHLVPFPTYISNSLIHHFIRGYFDGDGSIFIAKTSIGIGIIGEKLFIENFYEMIKSKLGGNWYKVKDKRNDLYSITTRNKKTILDFTNWIYQDATIYLDRKFNIYNTIKGDKYAYKS